MVQIDNNREKTLGILNLSNNCYLNSIFQCIAHSSLFIDYIISKVFDEDMRLDKNHIELIKEIRKTLILMWTDDNQIINPANLLKELQKYIISSGQDGIIIGNHNDANEFLIILLNLLNSRLDYQPNITINIRNKVLSDFDKVALEACKTWKNYFKDSYSKIIELFYGQFISEIKSPNDDISHCFDPFMNLDIEIPNEENTKLIECIDKFMSIEKIGDQNHTKKFYIWKFPKILIITLKRFGNIYQKNNNRIIYEETLDLSNYCKGYQRENIKYKLFSICCHKGELNYGHYIALCKKKNIWYKYDDTNVEKIGNGQFPMTSSAYILFYELK